MRTSWRMSRWLTIAAALAALCAPAAAPAQIATQAVGQVVAIAPDPSDATLVLDAVRADLAAVRLGELGEQQALNPQLRAFAAKLAADHARSLEDATALARTLGLRPPEQPTIAALEAHGELTALAGDAFETAFVEQAVQLQREALDAHQGMAKSRMRASRELAQRTIPMLEAHLREADALAVR